MKKRVTSLIVLCLVCFFLFVTIVNAAKPIDFEAGGWQKVTKTFPAFCGGSIDCHTHKCENEPKSFEAEFPIAASDAIYDFSYDCTFTRNCPTSGGTCEANLWGGLRSGTPFTEPQTLTITCYRCVYGSYCHTAVEGACTVGFYKKSYGSCDNYCASIRGEGGSGKMEGEKCTCSCSQGYEETRGDDGATICSEEEVTECSESWECEDWGECVDEKQTRVCECGCEDDDCTGEHKTKQACEEEVEIEPKIECSLKRLDLCKTKEECTAVGGYWYTKACHAESMEEDKQSIIDKINKGESLSPEEFVAFIKMIEEKNPSKNWKQIITQLHTKRYEEDVDLEFFWIRLFKNGKENEGYEDVDTLITALPPTIVILDDGTRFNVAHTYAGIRAGLNRGSIKSWFMTNVNTGWGDTVQVLGEYLKGNFKNAHRRKSDDQVLGNKASKQLQKYLRYYQNKALSEAYAKYFGIK